MKRSFFLTKFVSLGSLIIVSGGLPSLASADSDTKPAWMDSIGSNQSYLNNTHSNFLMDSSSKFFNDKMASEMRLQFSDFNRNYETRQRSGLTDYAEEQAHVGQMKDFGRNIMQQMKNFRVRETTRDLKDAAEKDEDLKTYAKVVGVVAAVGAVCSGEPMNIAIDEQTKFHSRTDVRSQTGQFAISNPVLDTQLDVSGIPPTRDPMGVNPVDPILKDERYRVSVSKQVPQTDITSRMSYGGTTTTMTASLIKPILSNLNANFNSQYPMVPSRSTVGAPEQSVGVNYQIKF